MMDALMKLDFDEAMLMPEEEKERFRVTDNSSANWCLRKIKALKTQQGENTQLAQKEIDRIKAWEEAENGKLQDSITFFEGLLIRYHMEQFEQDPKKKTISLPDGKLKARAQQPEFIRDDEKLVEYLRKAGRTDYIKVIEKPEWGEFKKIIEVSMDGKTVVDTQTGEIVEGVTAEIRPPKFSVEVD